MMVGFTTVILVALSYSGNVSDSCRSEWTFIKSPEPVVNQKMATEKIVLEEMVSENPVSAKRSPDFDLIIPNFLFGL